MSQIFHIWPDNSICTAEELPEMEHKGHLYVTVEMPDEDPYAVPTYAEVVAARNREMDV